MATKPFNDEISPERAQTPATTNNMDTSGFDRYRQGVEMTRARHWRMGGPKLTSQCDAHEMMVLNFGPRTGTEFLILDNLGEDRIEGWFEGLEEETQFTKSYLDEDYLFEISYLGGTGNDVVLTVVEGAPIPAPGAIVLASLGTGLVTWLRRRKRL